MTYVISRSIPSLGIQHYLYFIVYKIKTNSSLNPINYSIIVDEVDTENICDKKNNQLNLN